MHRLQERNATAEYSARLKHTCSLSNDSFRLFYILKDLPRNNCGHALRQHWQCSSIRADRLGSGSLMIGTKPCITAVFDQRTMPRRAATDIQTKAVANRQNFIEVVPLKSTQELAKISKSRSNILSREGAGSRASLSDKFFRKFRINCYRHNLGAPVVAGAINSVFLSIGIVLIETNSSSCSTQFQTNIEQHALIDVISER